MNRSSGSPASSARLSVVDDEPSVCHAIQRLLMTMNYQVECYMNAEELLRSPTLDQQDCLILDIQMPGLSGLDLQKVISARRTPIPIIFITAHGDDSIRQQAMDNGAAGFLGKPFDAQALIDLIQKTLKSRT